jgi:MFS family permease
MIQTISWMVQREELSSRARISRVILRWFLIGGLLGGAAAGLLVAGPARVIYTLVGNQLRLFVAAAVVLAIAYVGRPLKLWRVPKPQFAQQVPPSWRDVWPPRMASFLYAGVLGLGFFTRISSVALFPLGVLALGLGKWPLAIVTLFAITGLMRAATALIVPLFGWVEVSGSTIVNALGLRAELADRVEAIVLVAGAALLALATVS